MSATPLAPVHDAATVGKLLGIAYTVEQLAGFGPPPEPVPGFVTFFDPGWNILMLRATVKEWGAIFCPQNWFYDEPFAKVKDGPRYRQVLMEPFPNSTRKAFDEQVALLSDSEEVPTARVVIAALAIHFLVTAHRLFPNVLVRCADKTSNRNRVYVGDFKSDGLAIEVNWEDYSFGHVGLASARKSALSS